MKKRIVGFVAAGLFVVAGAGSASANPITINFESDATGFKPNGFQSNDSNLVSFTDTVGNALNIFNYGVQGLGQRSLAVNDDVDGSALQMTFGALMYDISLAFGNDDPGWSNPGDVAWLQLFNGVTLVGQVAVLMNRNDIMDQTISFSGAFFDRAVFGYGATLGNGFTGGDGAQIGLIEIVDNINLQAVPEPASLLLLGTGLAAIARKRMRRS